MKNQETLGITGIAKYLGVPINTVYGWKYRDQLPTPDGYVGASPWWYPASIDGWKRPKAKGVR